MIRWLDFNDTWLAAEWGHPSDNLGGILADGRLAVAQRGRRRQQAADRARRAHGDDQGARDPGLHRARELLQQGRPRSRRAGEGRLDRGGRADAGPVARRDHQCGIARMGRRPVAAHLPPFAEHRLAQELGGGRCDLARGAPGADRENGRDGLPLGADAPRPGASTMSCSRATSSSSSARTAATSWSTCCSRSASPRNSIRRPRSKQP